MTTATEIKLKRMPASVDHAYETEDGRFRVYRPATSADGWGIEDTQRWTWRLNTYATMPDSVAVEFDYYAQRFSLADCKAGIARAYERTDDTELYRVYRSEQEAHAAAFAYLHEERLERRARNAAEAERKRTPVAGPLTAERFAEDIYLVNDAQGRKVAQTDTIGNARLFAAAPDMLALLEEMASTVLTREHYHRIAELVAQAYGREA